MRAQLMVSKSGVLLRLSNPAEEFPSEISVRDVLFVRKEELHVMLVSSGLMRTLVAQAGEQVIEKLQSVSQDIRFCVYVQHRLYHASKSSIEGYKDSLVAPRNVPDAGIFFLKAKNILGLQDTFPTPPFHVTIYTADNSQSRGGVGLWSKEDFERYATAVPLHAFPPAVRDALASL